MAKIPVKPILKSMGKAADDTATELLKATDQAQAVRRAYHGSPHNFDKFSTSAIGTGEGAQAYGHGLYFSSSEDVARYYRDALTDKSVKLKEGFSETVIELRDRVQRKLDDLENSLPETYDPDYEKQIHAVMRDKRFLGDLLDGVSLEEAEWRLKRRLTKEDFGEFAVPSGDLFSVDKGKLYTVEIPDESMMLDWDAPLSEQPEGVREVLSEYAREYTDPEKALRDFLDTDYAKSFPDIKDVRWAREILENPEYDVQEDGAAWLASQMRAEVGSSFYNLLGSDKAGQLYERMARSVGGSDKASAALREAGIPGITYKGGSSGERNFVVFSDESVNIVEKGFVDPRLLAPVAGAAAVGAAYANEPEPATLDEYHAEKTANIAQREALDAMFDAADEAQPPVVREEPEDVKAGAPVPEGSMLGSIGEGAVESVSQVLGGVAEAANETFSLIKEVGDWANENIVDLGHIVYSDEEGFEHLSTDEYKARFESDAEFYERDRDYVPETPEADSVPGGIVRGIAQFAAGFIGFGKLKWLKNLRGLGTGGRITSDAIRGALADFTVFDPHEARLSNLIQQFPALQNPVTEYLAADEDDPALLGRLKGAVEGLIPGVAIDGLAEAFTKGIRALRGVRKAKKIAADADIAIKTEADEAAMAIEIAGRQRKRFTELLGDPDGPVLKPKPMDDVSARELHAAGDFVQEDVFVNWARIDTPDDVKRIIQEMANLGKEGIDEARRGVVGWQKTTLDAEALDAWELLASRRVGQPLNNAETLAVRELWARSGAKLRELTEAVVADDASELDMIAFRKMLAVHNAIQEQVVAARTETARALNAWKIPAGDNVGFIGQMDQLKAAMEGGGGTRITKDIAKRLKMLTDAGMMKEADQFVHGSRWAKSADMVAQLWYFSLLSGPKTHMRNGISNTAVLLNSVLERKVASLIGQAKGAQHIPDGEASALLFGMIQGVRDAFRISAKARHAMARSVREWNTGPIADAAEEFGTAWRSLATGETGIGVNKVELPRLGAMSPEKLGFDKASPKGRIFNVLDTTTTIPGRMLGAADEVFKAMNYRGEMAAQAFRRATKEFEAGKITDVQARIAELMSDPDEAMKLVSRKMAEVNTFTNEPLDTGMWRAFKTWGEIPVIGKLTLPFRRTPYNIGTYTFSRTPLAPLVRQWRQDIAAGGAKADLAWSKFLTGNAILLTMADLAMNGDITGEGPSNWNQRATGQRQNIKPSSVRIQTGGTDDDPEYMFFSYRGLEPMATSLGTAANIVEILKHTDWEDENAQVEELIMAASIAIASNLTSQQYMMGVQSMFEALSDGRRYGEQFWNRIAGAVIPTGIAEVARAKDPHLRAVYDMTSAIKARTPGLSETLPHKRDAWGRPITRESGLGTFYDAVSPIYAAKQDSQPIDLELTRLETWVGKPNKRTSFDGITVDMERYPVEYDRWTELQGQEITGTIDGAPIGFQGFLATGELNLMDELNLLVSGKHHMSMIYDMMTDGPDGGKAKYLRRIISEFRSAAKEHLLAESPRLKAEIDARKEQQQGRFIFQ